MASSNPVYKSFDKALIDNTKKEMAVPRRQKVFCEVEALLNKKFCLYLSLGKINIITYGKVVEQAKNAPVSQEEIIAQLSKTGNTPFKFECTRINIDDNIFIGKAELNQIRRASVENLESEILLARKGSGAQLVPTNINVGAVCAPHSKKQKLTIEISDLAYLQAAATLNIARIYAPFSEELLKMPKQNTEIFITLPQICRNETEKELSALLPLFEKSNIDGYLVSTYGQINMLKSIKTSKQIMLNYTFNILNNYAMQAFVDKAVTLSQELNINEINNITSKNFELIAYGRQTVMLTHNCPIGLYTTKNKNGKFCIKKSLPKSCSLRDKIGINFPILTDCKHCTAHILNSKILDTAPKFSALKSTNASSFRLIFTTENISVIRDTITRYKNALEGKPIQDYIKGKDTTYGHYFRGVE